MIAIFSEYATLIQVSSLYTAGLIAVSQAMFETSFEFFSFHH